MVIFSEIPFIKKKCSAQNFAAPLKLNNSIQFNTVVFILVIKWGWTPASPLWIEKCLYERYSGGKGWSLLTALLCFFTLRYPNTDTSPTKTTNPIQQPMISPSLLVKIDCVPIEWSGNIPIPTCRLSGAPKVLTSAHLLVGESTNRGRIVSANISMSLESFSEMWKLWDGISLKLKAQLPKARTQIRYLVSGYNFESFIDLEERSSFLPRIWNKNITIRDVIRLWISIDVIYACVIIGYLYKLKSLTVR